MKTPEERFGLQVRKLRTAAGLTQAELGERLGYSEKAVSKWERGLSVPTAEVLLAITKLFHITLDGLFREDRFYLLGIDGGGTKTHLVLADTDMHVLRELTVGGSNPIDIGIEAAKNTLREAIYTLCGDIPLGNIILFAGIAGGASSDMRATFSRFFEEFGFYAFENDSDNRNIVAAGLGKENGVSLILGTGICAFCQKDGALARVAGWGYLFDDGGSAFNIGRDGLATHFRALDGTGPQTAIRTAIEHTHPNPQTLLGELYRGGKREIASYARVVYAAAKEGDTVAYNIIRNNMCFAANIIKTATKDLPGERVPVVLAGGLTQDPLTLQLLREALPKENPYDLRVLDTAPVGGALLLARELYNTKGAAQ